MSSIDDEIARRLRKLKNDVERTGRGPSGPPREERRTAVEEVEELLERMSKEAVLDRSAPAADKDIDSEIRKRLDKLKSETVFAAAHPLPNPLIQMSEPVKKAEEEEDEELPWCVICNEDASLRCSGCDGDLYCSRCFRQYHDKDDLPDHQSTPFHK